MLWPMVMPSIIKRTSAKFTFRAGCLLFLVITAAIPSMRAAKQTSNTMLWACLYTFSLVRSIAGATSFTSNSIILNSLLADHQGIGFFNGVNDSLAAFGKSLAPTVTGSLFATFTQEPALSGWPLDEHLPFYFLSSLCVFSVLISLRFGDVSKAR